MSRKNRTDGAFHQVYSICRANRTNVHFQGQLFRFGGDGDIYIGDCMLVIGRRSRIETDHPGFHAGSIGGKGYSKSTRRLFLEFAQRVGAVPLP